MKRIFSCAALLLSMVFASAVFSDEITEAGAVDKKMRLSMEDAVNLAFANNLDLQSATVNLGTKKRASDYVWNNFIPTISGAASLTGKNKVSSSYESIAVPVPIEGYDNYYVTVMDPTKEKAGSRWGFGGSVGIQWQGLNVALFEGVKQIKSDYSAGLISLDNAKKQLEQTIRNAYLDLLLLHENLKLQESSLRLAEDQVKTSEQNYLAGLSSELTLLQARVNRDNLLPQVSESRDNIRLASASLAMQIGLPFDSEFELDSIKPENLDYAFDVSGLVQKAAGTNPDILALKASIITTKHTKTVLKLNLFTPSLSLGWTYQPALLHDAFKGSWAYNDSNWTDAGGFSLSLSWSLNNVLPFSKEYANLSTVNDTLRALDISLAQAIQGAELSVYSTVYSLEQAQKQIKAQRATVALAERTYNLTLQAFQAGLQDLISLQNAELQLRQARIGVLNQEFTFLKKVIDLEYTAGIPYGSLLAE